MHLDHKIPWHTVCSHIKIFLPPPQDEQTHVPPRLPHLRPHNHPRQTSDLNHFARVFASTIREFSDSERAKCEKAGSDERSTRPLFSDSWRDKHIDNHDVFGLEPDMQDIDTWIDAGQRKFGPPGFPSPYANTVKALMDPQGPDARLNLVGLLRLARHSDVPVENLEFYGQACQHGFSAILDVTLKAYIYLNVISCLPSEQWQNLQLDPGNLDLVRTVMDSCDYDAQ